VNRDLRERIAASLDKLTDDEVEEIVRTSLEAEKVVWVDITCKDKNCGKTHRYPVTVPNWMERAKVLDILVTQSKGKPAEAKQVVEDTAVKDVEGMTLAELEAEERRLLEAYPQLAAAGNAAPPRPKRRRAPAR
jgi:hypothetical protein